MIIKSVLEEKSSYSQATTQQNVSPFPEQKKIDLEPEKKEMISKTIEEAESR